MTQKSKWDGKSRVSNDKYRKLFNEINWDKGLMSFEVNKYQLLPKAISSELANFVYQYFLLKRKVANKLIELKYINPEGFVIQSYINPKGEILAGRDSQLGNVQGIGKATEWGFYSDPQALNSYSHYADIAMETLMLKCQPIIEKSIGLNLVPTYSYARIYKRGDTLIKHKDRPSCEISSTMFLGGDEWNIYMEGKPFRLKVGDILIYKGCELEHWRNKFKGNHCCQVFLHYNSSNKNKYDGRESLGYPYFLRERKEEENEKK